MSPWVILPAELARSHPKFGIKGLASLLRFMLVLSPSLWVLGAIGDIMEIIEVRGHLQSSDYLRLVAPSIFLVWSGWNVHLLGKRDSRFIPSFLVFLAIGPVIIVVTELLWLMNSGFQFKVDTVARTFFVQSVAWCAWALLLAAYVLLSKRLNVTLRQRVRSNDPINKHAGD